ncbi:MAG: histidinol-phosphate transaminase [Candidatus Thioglobus sp.]|nr:MAG: histidinol-phosphate transaminase [Candidatus Thioglobus sp.]
MSFINNWLRADIQALDAYHIQPAENLLKLDAMESPFSLTDGLEDKYLAHLSSADLRRYPSPDASELQQNLRKLMQIPAELDMLLGNGSDELIQLLCLACASGDTVLSLEPSFVMYKMIAKFTHLNYQSVDLNADFELDLPLMLAAIKTHKPKLIFIAYPNNPTGNAFDRSAIEKIITSSAALVVLDEAYYAYADDSFLADIQKYPNLLLLRTVSKIGLAGLRLGLLIAEKGTIKQLDKLRLPYNIGGLTQAAANFLLQENSTIATNAKIIIRQRGELSKALAAIDGLMVYPSQANFILFKAPKADELFAYLRQNKVLIKNLSAAPKLTNCLRVTIGNSEQNRQFISIVEGFYG